MHNELIRMHERVEELINDALEYTREMSSIASELYGEAVNVGINGDGYIMYTRESDCEELDISDITGRPRIYTNHRPMDSMTEEEREEYQGLCLGDMDIDRADALMDWLHTYHFDYRGLIGKGLALEAPDGMYSTI